MIAIDSYVPAIVPAAFTFRMSAWSDNYPVSLRIFRLRHACLGGDDYQPEIVTQRIEQQKIFPAGAYRYRGSKRRTNFSKGTRGFQPSLHLRAQFAKPAPAPYQYFFIRLMWKFVPGV